jgi:hypothetical protein
MDKPIKLRLTFWSHFKTLWIIPITVLPFGYLIYLSEPSKQPLLFGIFGMYFFTMLFPLIYLHITYFNYNQNSYFELYKNKSIVKHSNGTKTTYEIEDFKDFKFIAMASKFAGISGKLPFSDYHYAKLILLNGEELVITSLYSSDIYDYIRNCFSEVPSSEISVLYPNISEVD